MTSVTVTSTLQWLDPPADSGPLRISCRVPEGLPATTGAAVIAFDLDGVEGADDLAGTGLYLSKSFGPFLYLEGPEGATEFAAALRLPEGRQLRRVGLRLWNHDRPIVLDDLAFTPAPPPSEAGRSFLVNVSVDVEALPHRAAADHVERLIFGRVGGGEHGIGAQMRLFRELGVPATFYLECAQAAHHGRDAVRRAAQAILGEGFDLQLHLHAEELVRAEGWPWPEGIYPGLQNLNQRDTRRAMAYAAEVFLAAAEQEPRAFRAGSYQFNRHTLDAGAALGIDVFSNYRTDYPAGNSFDFEENPPVAPFRWSNGIAEFPVTVSPEPLSALSPETVWERILHLVDGRGTWFVNIVLHSWSFLKRDARGFNETPDPALPEALRRIVALAPARARFVSMAETAAALKAGTLELAGTRSPNALVRREPLPLPPVRSRVPA